MSDSIRKKAVTVIRITLEAARGDKDAVTVDIQPGEVFDCPKNLVAELNRSGAITAPGKTTPVEAIATASTSDEGIDPEVHGQPELSKDDLIEKAEALGVDVDGRWSVQRIEEAIAGAESHDEDDPADVM